MRPEQSSGKDLGCDVRGQVALPDARQDITQDDRQVPPVERGERVWVVTPQKLLIDERRETAHS